MRQHRPISSVVVFLLLSSSLPANEEEAQVVPLPRAHAHNDYHHPRPLLDALSHGFCSVEADIFLQDGELLVGHDRSELRSDRTLKSLYLEPLLHRTRETGGKVYPGGPTFTLLVDIKADGEATFQELHRQLAQYREMLSWVSEGKKHPGAVEVIISGDRPFEAIRQTQPCYVGIDGRLSDLESDRPAHLMPLISDRWSSHFRWRGQGPFPKEERRKLHRIVREAHQAGRRVRFWATPENSNLWEALVEAEVDLINTDDLEGLKRFLLWRSGNPAQECP